MHFMRRAAPGETDHRPFVTDNEHRAAKRSLYRVGREPVRCGKNYYEADQNGPTIVGARFEVIAISGHYAQQHDENCGWTT
jgi:hypothetical protein